MKAGRRYKAPREQALSTANATNTAVCCVRRWVRPVFTFVSV